MATKKSQSVHKTKTTKKSAPKAAPRKIVHATEPYHPGFGLVLLLVSAIIAAVLLLAATKSIIRATYTDAERFAESYSEVEKDNIFKIKNAKDIIDILEQGTGIVFFGFPRCPWCQTYAPMLNNLAKSYGAEEIYYFNIYEDRERNTENYQKIVSLLKDYLQYDNTGKKRVYVPEVVFVVEGKIIGNDHETSKDTLGLQDPGEYWTEARVSAWKEKLGSLIEKVVAKSGCTTTCND